MKKTEGKKTAAKKNKQRQAVRHGRNRRFANRPTTGPDRNRTSAFLGVCSVCRDDPHRSRRKTLFFLLFSGIASEGGIVSTAIFLFVGFFLLLFSVDALVSSIVGVIYQFLCIRDKLFVWTSIPIIGE